MLCFFASLAALATSRAERAFGAEVGLCAKTDSGAGAWVFRGFGSVVFLVEVFLEMRKLREGLSRVSGIGG
jgi:hypothetical protein